MGYAWRKETREMYTYISRLRKSGLKGESLEKAIAAVKGAKASGTPVKIPKAVREEIGAILARGEKAVVTRGQKGAVRAYAMKGYENLVEKGRAAAIAQRGNAKAAAKPARRGRRKQRKQYVHWTKKPENADKFARVKANLKYARARANAGAAGAAA